MRSITDYSAIEILTLPPTDLIIIRKETKQTKALTEVVLMIMTMADIGGIATGPAYAACIAVGNLLVHPYTE
eukprot:Pgem_evm1s6140